MSALRAHTCERTEGIGTSDVLANELEDRSMESAEGVDGSSRDDTDDGLTSAERADAVSGVDVSEMQATSAETSAHSASGVAARGGAAASRGVPRLARTRAQSGEQSRPSESRAQSFNRYLSAQNDIDEEVLRLYKLVCRV